MKTKKVKVKGKEKSKRVLLIIAILLVILSLINFVNMLTITGKATYGTVGICLNHPPVIENISHISVNHNSLLSIQVNATDSDGQNISYSCDFSLFEINNVTGLINFTPTINQIGNYSIKISVRDYSSDCPSNVSAIFSLEIYNSPPIVSTIPNFTWEEDVTLTGINLGSYFSDPNGDNLTFTNIPGNNVSVNISLQGVVTFKPDKDWYGASWVIFTANDSRSTISSDNITLNVTHIGNYCGDGICNANESCSACSADCGSCPPGETTGGGGGGGGRTEIIEKIVSLPLKEVVCEEKVRCNEWSPLNCKLRERQNQVCLMVKKSCAVVERTETRDCVCQPEWVCSPWGECTKEGRRSRQCQDKQECGLLLTLPLEKECAYAPSSEKYSQLGILSWKALKEWGAGINRAGGAIWSGMKRDEQILSLSYGTGILLLSLSAIFMLLRYLHFHRRKKSVILDTIDVFSEFCSPADEKEDPIYIGTTVEINSHDTLKVKILVGSLQKEEFAYEIDVNSNTSLLWSR